jgi:hypothetical protein
MRSRRRKWVIGSLVAVLALAIVLVVWAGPVLIPAWQRGFFTPIERQTYDGTVEENLRQIHTALMLYHESEERFPGEEEWMDMVSQRIVTYTLGADEAMKKLVNPRFAGAEGQYGFAFNAAAAGQYAEDLDPSMPLVFESTDGRWNAAGTPEQLAPREGPAPRAITVEGNVVELGD